MLKNRQIWKPNGCPTFPIATFKQIGRLGNLISSYANFIAMDWEFGIKLFLNKSVKKKLQEVFKNVTFFIHNEKCNLKFKFLKNLDPFLEKQIQCKHSRNDNMIPCLPSELGKIQNIWVDLGHNVSSAFIQYDLHCNKCNRCF